MMNFKRTLSLITLLGFGVVLPVFADVAIIAHPDNPAKPDQTQIRNIYLGKVKVFNNGVPAVAVDIRSGDPSRKLFVDKVLHKSEANLNAYWARMLFSSKGRPPEELENSAAVIKAVAANKSAIGYVDAKDVNDTVRVLMIVK